MKILQIKHKSQQTRLKAKLILSCNSVIETNMAEFIHKTSQRILNNHQCCMLKFQVKDETCEILFLFKSVTKLDSLIRGIKSATTKEAKKLEGQGKKSKYSYWNHYQIYTLDANQ
jgi:hypothetical protein